MARQQKIDWIMLVVKDYDNQRCDLNQWGCNAILFIKDDELMVENDGKISKFKNLPKEKSKEIASLFGILTI